MSLIDKLEERFFWLKFDLELWYGRLPTVWYCLKNFFRTGELSWLHDSLKSLLP